MGVDFKFTGDAGQLAGEYDKLVSKVDKLEAQNAKLAAKAKQADAAQKQSASSAASGFRNAATGVLSWAASFASVQTAISLVNQGLEDQRRLAEQSHQTQMRVAGSQAAVLKNLGDVSDKEAKSFLYSVDQIRQETGFASVVPLQQAAASILSATGGNKQLTLDILAAEAPLMADSPDQMAGFGGALGDLTKSTGVKDMRKLSALALSIQGQARFETLGGFDKVASALAAANEVTGGIGETEADQLRDAREASAAFAAIGSNIADKDGSQTKTASANLFANLARVTNEAVAAGKVAPEKVDTFNERMAYVRANPDLQQEVTKSGFEGAVKPVIQSFLSERGGETQVGKDYEAALKNIGASEDAFTRKKKQLRGLTPELSNKALDDATTGNTEDFLRTFDPATSRGILEKALPLTRGEGVSAFFGGTRDNRDLLAFDAAMSRGEDPREKATKILKDRERALIDESHGAFNLNTKNDPIVEKSASDHLLRQIYYLREQRAELGDTSEADPTARQLAETPEGLKTLKEIRDLTTRKLTGNTIGAARREVMLPSE